MQQIISSANVAFPVKKTFKYKLFEVEFVFFFLHKQSFFVRPSTKYFWKKRKLEKTLDRSLYEYETLISRMKMKDDHFYFH